MESDGMGFGTYMTLCWLGGGFGRFRCAVSNSRFLHLFLFANTRSNVFPIPWFLGDNVWVSDSGGLPWLMAAEVADSGGLG